MSSPPETYPRAGRTSRRQLPEEVAGYIRDRIMSGELRPGEFLRMEPIAETVGVSITPVREGLVALASEGYVTALPRRGFVVASFTREDVQDVFWTQAQLAGELAARAAKRMTEQELAELAEIHEACNQAIRNGDIAASGHLRRQFHRAINLGAHSPRLARLLGGAVKQLPSHYYLRLEEHADEELATHAAIFEAISTQDSASARRLVKKHRTDAARNVIALLEARGFWQD
ncbi:GntR family transcriptional regulator [Brevibacterium sp. VCM10]|uniref:GntR family transcriptional regulator n=1 Tax=Brevibacterium sp. VCM10 TaxID=1381751 RepID=UPI0004719969|nr:GntR family transcriptional regulator [Brevibacterium sp. VCM10]